MTLQNLLELGSFLLLSILAVSYLFSRLRQQDMEILRKSNLDLRDSIEDKGKEIRDMKVEMGVLTSRINSLEAQNKTLQELVLQALSDFFVKNPDLAVKIHSTLK